MSTGRVWAARGRSSIAASGTDAMTPGTPAQVMAQAAASLVPQSDPVPQSALPVSGFTIMWLSWAAAIVPSSIVRAACAAVIAVTTAKDRTTRSATMRQNMRRGKEDRSQLSIAANAAGLRPHERNRDDRDP